MALVAEFMAINKTPLTLASELKFFTLHLGPTDNFPTSGTSRIYYSANAE